MLNSTEKPLFPDTSEAELCAMLEKLGEIDLDSALEQLGEVDFATMFNDVNGGCDVG